MMGISFVRNENGELVAVDSETKKPIGKITSMGDVLSEDEEKHENQQV